MNPVEVSDTAKNRIKGLIGIRESVRRLIDLQTEDYPDADIQAEQAKLNTLYDDFGKKYGLINSRGNTTAFSSDSSYCLLASLEVLDDDGNFVRKADMFTKRTIKQKVIVQSVDTASEALALSLAEKTMVDMAYMTQLTGKPEEELFKELRGVIFLNPLHTSEQDHHPKYLPADEYLSGNVREKLRIARRRPMWGMAYTALYAALRSEGFSDGEIDTLLPEQLSQRPVRERVAEVFVKAKVRYDVQPTVQLSAFCPRDRIPENQAVRRKVLYDVPDVDHEPIPMDQRVDRRGQPHGIIGKQLLPVLPQVVILHIDHKQRCFHDGSLHVFTTFSDAL